MSENPAAVVDEDSLTVTTIPLAAAAGHNRAVGTCQDRVTFASRYVQSTVKNPATKAEPGRQRTIRDREHQLRDQRILSAAEGVVRAAILGFASGCGFAAVVMCARKRAEFSNEG
jgi:hypothetical protein